MSYRLPNDQYKYTQSLYSNFNNQLLSGINSGLSLYDRDRDTKLYKPTDWKPLDAVSFDKINEDLDKYEKNYTKNDDIFNNTKSYVEGAIAGLNKSTDDSLNSLKNLFNFDLSSFKIYGLLLFIFLIIRK